ncbi:MAG: hypothetical protein KBG54_01875 [Oscillospiraceae bacterium]|nr:hypothetical protein [Oscillospiraceae bacterium]
MTMDERLECEYKIVTPTQQPYARFPATKAAEKAWWAEYHKRNPTLWMRLAKALRSGTNPKAMC